MPTDNPSRERILQRIHKGLGVTVLPSHHAATSGANIFPPVPNLLERFQKECSTNNTEVVLTANMEGSYASIRDIVASLPAGEIFLQDVPELRSIRSAWPQDKLVRWSSEGRPSEASQATITLIESLVADTGSILVSSSCGGRGASVVAPVHIVVAGLSQLVPSLETAFARLEEGQTALRNSMLCLITGSSRTADIEKILVLGAHGPRRVVVILSQAD